MIVNYYSDIFELLIKLSNKVLQTVSVTQYGYMRKVGRYPKIKNIADDDDDR